MTTTTETEFQSETMKSILRNFVAACLITEAVIYNQENSSVNALSSSQGLYTNKQTGSYRNALHINPASPSRTNALFLLPEQAAELVEAANLNYDFSGIRTPSEDDLQFSGAILASAKTNAAMSQGGGVSGRNAANKTDRRGTGLFFSGLFSRGSQQK